MRVIFFYLLVLSFSYQPNLYGQSTDTTKKAPVKFNDSLFIIRYDTLLHLQSWISTNEMEYTIRYNEDFKLVLAPNQINNLNFGFTYRWLDVGIGYSPNFLNTGQDPAKKGKSNQFSFRTSFSFQRFNLAFDLNSITGFYLKNTKDFIQAASLPDTPYLIFPDLQIGYFSVLLKYNMNRKFSTSALSGGSQVQKKSAISFIPGFQFATFKFTNDSKDPTVQNESTYSTDLNLLLPIYGTWVISSKFQATLGVGPSFGVDFFKSVALDDTGKLAITKGTKFTSGYTAQLALSFSSRRFFAGLETRARSYGHKIEDVSRLIKQYSYFQIYFGYRLRAPKFMRKSLDWANKVSPVELD